MTSFGIVATLNKMKQKIVSQKVMYMIDLVELSGPRSLHGSLQWRIRGYDSKYVAETHQEVPSRIRNARS